MDTHGMSKLDEAIKLLDEQPGVEEFERKSHYDWYLDLQELITNRVLPLLCALQEETT